MGPDDQCAMTVLPAATTIAEHIVRVLPYVHRDSDLLLCFFGVSSVQSLPCLVTFVMVADGIRLRIHTGYLKNSQDLEDRLECLDLGEHSDDIGSVTTGILTGLYRQLGDRKKEELILSEIQVGLIAQHSAYQLLAWHIHAYLPHLYTRGAMHSSSTMPTENSRLPLEIRRVIKSFSFAWVPTTARSPSRIPWSSSRQGKNGPIGGSCHRGTTSLGALRRLNSLRSRLSNLTR